MNLFMLKVRRALYSVWDAVREDYALWISRAMAALCIFISFLMVETLNENNILRDLYGWQIMWNLIWYFLLWWVFRLIFRRNNGATAALAVASFGFGLANHYVLKFRGRTIFPIDVLAIKTAANVSSGYDYTPDTTIWLAFGMLVVFLGLLIALPKPGRRKMKRRVSVTVCGAAAALLIAFFATPMLPACDIYAQQWNTTGNGFLFNFMVSLRYSFVTEPDGYSVQQVENIKTKVEEHLQTGQSQQQPTQDSQEWWQTVTAPEDDGPVNLIVIMNESLCDYSVFENFESTCDPLEFYHSLSENTIKGYTYSPVIGGGTATVEFEYLTGSNVAFLPEGTVAYQIYLDSPMPSMATMCSEAGFETWAFHPYLASGWNRTNAYRYLGFDHQLYDEDVENPEYVREYISDRCDYEVIKSITEAEKGDKTFVFNVTMQNHSSYDQGWNNLRRTCTTKGGLAHHAGDPMTQYLSLVDESDEALQELVEFYAQSDEKTMIVMFGDHQPPFNNEFYESLYGKSMDDRTPEEALTSYMTPFFIWANYDIPEQENVCISMSYLGALTAKMANLPMSDYNQFLLSVMEELPVIHTIGCVTGDGTFIQDRDDLPDDLRRLLEEYEYLNYYNIFDRDQEERSDRHEDEFFIPEEEQESDEEQPQPDSRSDEPEAQTIRQED